MVRCLLALGSNLGDRHAILESCCAEVAALEGCQLLARSRWHATAPIGGAEGQGAFLNGALLIATSRLPLDLATALQEIETRLGRQRVARWDARVIDIDMLLYSESIIDTPRLVVPHPRMTFRRFVLEPAIEIAGAMLHPSAGWTLTALLAHLQRSERYVVVTASERPIANWMLRQLRETLGCPVRLVPSTSVVAHGNNINQENAVGSGVTRITGGVEFPERLHGAPPVVATMSPSALDVFRTATEKESPLAHPALIIALEPANCQRLRDAAQLAAQSIGSQQSSRQNIGAQQKTASGPLGVASTQSPPALPSAGPPMRLDPVYLGPLARITADSPATVLQEASAAVRCVWPDIDRVVPHPGQANLDEPNGL